MIISHKTKKSAKLCTTKCQYCQWQYLSHSNFQFQNIWKLYSIVQWKDNWHPNSKSNHTKYIEGIAWKKNLNFCMKSCFPSRFTWNWREFWKKFSRSIFVPSWWEKTSIFFKFESIIFSKYIFCDWSAFTNQKQNYKLSKKSKSKLQIE